MSVSVSISARICVSASVSVRMSVSASVSGLFSALMTQSLSLKITAAYIGSGQSVKITKDFLSHICLISSSEIGGLIFFCIGRKGNLRFFGSLKLCFHVMSTCLHCSLSCAEQRLHCFHCTLCSAYEREQCRLYFAH